MRQTDTLDKLRELTDKLPVFPETVAPLFWRGEKGDKGDKGETGAQGHGSPDKQAPQLEITSNGYAEYRMEHGDCFAWFIHRSGNDIAVHRWFNSKGTIFPEHTHPEKEFIVIYKGIMDITKNGETQRLVVGDYIYNEPLTIHSAYFPEDCKYITVTIPPAKEFPNGK